MTFVRGYRVGVCRGPIVPFRPLTTRKEREAPDARAAEAGGPGVSAAARPAVPGLPGVVVGGRANDRGGIDRWREAAQSLAAGTRMGSVRGGRRLGHPG